MILDSGKDHSIHRDQRRRASRAITFIGCVQQLGRETVHAGCDERTRPNTQVVSPKPLGIAGLGDTQQSNATDCESEGGATRTPDLRIKSPLLYQLSYAPKVV